MKRRVATGARRPSRSAQEAAPSAVTIEAACLLLALPAIWPLLREGFPWGHDTGAHLFRIAEVARSLQDGVLYPRFAPDAYGGLGGPILDFNPVLPYYFPALLVLGGLGAIAALKIAAGTAVIAAGFAARTFARPHTGRSGAAIAGLASIYLPFRIADLFVRMAFSELFAMAVLPLALATMRRAVRNPSPKTITIAALTTALIPASHFPSTVIGLPVILLYALFVSRRRRGGRTFAAVAVTLTMAMALSAFAWLPPLADQAGTHYDDSTSGYDSYRNHFLDWPQLFSMRWGFGPSLPGGQDQMSFQIGWAHLLALGLAIALTLRRRRPARPIFFASALAIAGSALMLKEAKPVWDQLTVLQNIQFPWRLLMIVGVGTSLAAGLAAGAAAASMPPRYRLAAHAAMVLVLFVACVPYLEARTGEGSDADFTPEAIRRQYFGELKFQPKGVEKMRFVPDGPRATLLDASGAVLAAGAATILEERTHRTSVDVDAPIEATLRLHLFATPGWKGSAAGRDLILRAEPRTALILVDVPAGRNRVDLVFGDTPVRRIAWLLSGFSALALASTLAAGAWRRDRA